MYRVAVAALVFGIGIVADAQEKPSERIIWRAENPEQPYFIGADAMSKEAVLPGMKHAVAAFRGALDGATPKPPGELHCARPPIGEMGPRSEANRNEFPTLDEYVHQSPLAVVAVVSAVDPGWVATDRGYVGSLVTATVSEILTDRLQAFRPGTQVTRVQQAGLLTRGGVTLCTTNPGNYLAHIGDHILIVGRPDPVNTGNVLGSDDFVFPIVDGAITLPPAAIVDRSRASIPLQLLRKTSRPGK